MFKNTVLLIVALAITPFAVQAKSTPKTDKSLQVSLREYELAVRWNDFELAAESLDPLILSGERLTDEAEQYYKGFEISGYNLKTSTFADAMNYTQRVELRIIERDTQIERIKVDKQSWRYDEIAKRWWLTSGLPKLE